MGARLLQRTSRRLNLTDEGQAYYEASVRLLGEVDAAESAIGRGAISPGGRHTSGAIGRFRPHVCRAAAARILCLLSGSCSRRQRLGAARQSVRGRAHVAICIAFLSYSTLLARRILSMGVVTVASPEDLRQFRRALDFLLISNVTRPSSLHTAAFRDPGCSKVPPASSRSGLWGPLGQMTPNISAQRSGPGSASRTILAGSWPRILPQAQFSRCSATSHRIPIIDAVYPGARIVPAKVKVFVDFLAQVFAREPSLRIR